MFVVAEDFDVIPFNLPGLDKVVNTFDQFVEDQEDEQLRKVFGTTFWGAFKAGVEALPDEWDAATAWAVNDLVVFGNSIYKALQNSTNIKPGSDVLFWELQSVDRWLVLKNGANYTTDSDRTYTWAGMKAAIKPMIYSQWVRYAIDNQLSGVGNVKAKSENSVVISPNVRITEMWNKFSDGMIGRFELVRNSIFGYLYYNSITFDDVTPDFNSFFDYLNSEFVSPGRQNDLDL